MKGLVMILAVFFSFLQSTNVPEVTTTHEETIWRAPEYENYDNYGRLRVETIDVPLYFFDRFCEESQGVIDCENAAIIVDLAYWFEQNMPLIITDHCNHGFDALYDVVPGQTIAQITYQDGTFQQFICEIKDREGRHTGEQIEFSDSNNYFALEIPSDWIIMYTCNPEGWWSVTITAWRPIM